MAIPLRTGYEDADYIVYTKAGTYYAKDAQTGDIAYGGPNNVGGVSGKSPSAVIQSAINALPNGGKVFIKKGDDYVLLSGTQITFRKYVYVESDGAILRNLDTQYPFVTPSNDVFYNASIKGLVLDASNVVNSVGLFAYGVQRSQIDVTIKNATYGLDLRCPVGATAIETILKTNCILSHYRLQIENVTVAVQLLGTDVDNVVTDSVFEYIYATRIHGIGLRLVQWCDTLHFDQVFLSMDTENSYGIVFNDSATPGSEVGVEQLHFDHLIIDGFTLLSVNGLWLNACKKNVVESLIAGPLPFPGTLVTDNAGRSISHLIRNVAENIILVKGWAGDGTATILNGWATVYITHSLVSTPTLVKLTGKHSEVSAPYVTAVDATGISVAVAAPVTANRDLFWYAET